MAGTDGWNRMSQESEIRIAILTQAAASKPGSGLTWQEPLCNEIASELIIGNYVQGNVDEHGMAVITGIREKGQKELETQAATKGQKSMPTIQADPKKVFVVHGRNNAARDSMFIFLRSIGLQPIEWSQAIQLTHKASPFIGEILDSAFSHALAIVVLMTPDDIACLQSHFLEKNDPSFERDPTPQPRPNVLFEAGMAMGRCPERTVIVQVRDIRPFSDIGGRHVVRLNNRTQTRQDLAERLKNCGCDVDISGRDWHTVGDFDGSIPALKSEFAVPTTAQLDQPTRSQSDRLHILPLLIKESENAARRLEHDGLFFPRNRAVCEWTVPTDIDELKSAFNQIKSLKINDEQQFIYLISENAFERKEERVNATGRLATRDKLLKEMAKLITFREEFVNLAEQIRTRG